MERDGREGERKEDTEGKGQRKREREHARIEVGKLPRGLSHREGKAQLLPRSRLSRENECHWPTSSKFAFEFAYSHRA